MTRDKDYLQTKLDDAQKEVDVLRENEKELKSKYESKKRELIRKERNYNDQVKRFEDEIDRLKIEKRELNTKLNFEVLKNKGGEKDFGLLSTGIGSGSAHMVSSRVISGISRASSGYGSAALKDLEVILTVYDHFV